MIKTYAPANNILNNRRKHQKFNNTLGITHRRKITGDIGYYIQSRNSFYAK